MITYVHKSGHRYPEHGCFGSFTTWSNKRFEHFIRPGYPQCTNGWKRVNAKDWTREEIPDLKKPFTDQEWKDYAARYGTTCAQEFFDCCDIMKPKFAFQMIHPPTGKWNEETRAWFKATFESDIDRFICGWSMMAANHYAIDILRFERHLANWFGYPHRQDGSMRDFMIKRFGQETTDRFEALIKT